MEDCGTDKLPYYDNNGKKWCLTQSQCSDKGFLYTEGGRVQCFNKTQCASKGLLYYDRDDWKYKCITQAECNKKDPLPYNENGEAWCVPREDCKEDKFVLDDTRCVSAATCAKEGRFAYY